MWTYNPYIKDGWFELNPSMVGRADDLDLFYLLKFKTRYIMLLSLRPKIDPNRFAQATLVGFTIVFLN